MPDDFVVQTSGPQREDSAPDTFVDLCSHRRRSTICLLSRLEKTIARSRGWYWLSSFGGHCERRGGGGSVWWKGSDG
jgi:hypothetical protein